MRKKRLKKLKKISLKIGLRGLTILISIFFLFLLLMYVVKILADSSIFLIKDVKSTIQLDKEILEYFKGKSLFKVDMEKIYSKIYRDHPEYKQVRIIKEFPSSIIVEIKVREPFTQLKLDKFYILDREGVVIDIKPYAVAGLIPIEINYKYSLRKGFKIDDKEFSKIINIAVNLIDEINNKSNFFKNFPIRLINISNPSEIYFMIENVKIIIATDFKEKLGVLEHIVNKELRGDLSLVDYIDLRFDKVYLGYKK